MVVGFYSLAVGSVDPEAAPSRVMKGLARHPVPVMILARLAVDKEHHRKGLGQALLSGRPAAHGTGRRHRRHSLPVGPCQGRRSAAVVRIVGIRAQPDRSVSLVPDAQGSQEPAGLEAAEFSPQNPTVSRLRRDISTSTPTAPDVRAEHE
ncbi:MAG: GNAT family N-acetyltransferase [Burkholderiaceae bacterium]